jgi:hypothetical protein
VAPLPSALVSLVSAHILPPWTTTIFFDIYKFSKHFHRPKKGDDMHSLCWDEWIMIKQIFFSLNPTILVVTGVITITTTFSPMFDNSMAVSFPIPRPLAATIAVSYVKFVNHNYAIFCLKLTYIYWLSYYHLIH